jgi:hypothetical protein
LIIVPIDDPDLAHGSVVDMLNAIQILGSVPGIVPLTCFSPGDLNGAWITARRKMDSTLSDERLWFLLARHLEKVFPYRCRFEIEAIAPHERTQFVPIGGKGTLQRKLKTLRAEAEKISAAAWPIDEALCQDSQRHNLPNPLPDNARTLVQLWEALDALEAAPEESKEQLLHLTLKRATHILGEQLAAQLGKTISQMVHIGPPPVDGEAKRLMTCELEVSNLFVSAEGSGPSMPEELSIAEISLRPLYRVRIAPSSDSASRSSDSEPNALDAAGTSAVLAIQEIALGSGLYDIMGTTVYLGRDEWRFLQTVWLANQPTDNAFLLLPNATTLSELHRCIGLWNTLTDLSKGMPTQELLATTVHAACLIRDPEAPLEPRADYAEEFDRACEAYLKCRAEKSYTSGAFVRWFEEELPMQWHSALISRGQIRRFTDRHRELRSESIEGDRHEQGQRQVASFFDTRINLLLDALEAQDDTDISQHSWPAGYFELASAFGSQHLPRLSHLYTRWQRDLTGVHAGSATIGAIAEVGSKAVLAPYETPEGTQLVAAGIAALQRERAQARSRFRSE